MLLVAMIIVLVAICAGMIFLFSKIISQNVTQATQHLDEMNKTFEVKEKKIAQEFDDAKRKAQAAVLKAQQEAEELKVDIIKHAQEERDATLAQARQRAEEMMLQADKSRHQMLAEMEQRINREAVRKACELIQNVLPDDFRAMAHERWTNDLIAHGFEQLSHLQLPAELNEVSLTCAAPLTDAQRQAIAKKLSSAFGRNVALKESVDGQLIAGLILGIGSTELDGSLRNKIFEKAR